MFRAVWPGDQKDCYAGRPIWVRTHGRTKRTRDDVRAWTIHRNQPVVGLRKVYAMHTPQPQGRVAQEWATSLCRR